MGNCNQRERDQVILFFLNFEQCLAEKFQFLAGKNFQTSFFFISLPNLTIFQRKMHRRHCRTLKNHQKFGKIRKESIYRFSSPNFSPKNENSSFQRKPQSSTTTACTSSYSREKTYLIFTFFLQDNLWMLGMVLDKLHCLWRRI